MVKQIKCVVWDLDNTLWDGILVESKDVKLKYGILKIIKELDSRGILQSIASKNNFEDAIDKLEKFGIKKYFIYPQIGWSAKSISLKKIQEKLNIGMDSILFIDDQAFEREEVKFINQEIHCMDAIDFKKLLLMPELIPPFITKDSKNRRLMYIEEGKRKEEEENFIGPKEKFLESLNMKFIISEAKEEDLQRAEELTVRTNQLNATGLTYSYEELDMFRLSKGYKLLVCELSDKYGTYGKIGIALIKLEESIWKIQLLLMSCRVTSRGVGSVLLAHIMQKAKENGKKLIADFKKTKRNKIMYATYIFANFKEKEQNEDGSIELENDLSIIPEIPSYIQLKVIEDTQNEATVLEDICF